MKAIQSYSFSIRNFLSIVVCALFVAGCGGGSVAELDTHQFSKSGYQSPNYHPYTTGSHVYRWNDTIYVGGDVEPREKLREVLTDANGITYFMGASRDGVGVNRIENYEYDLKTDNGNRLFSQDGFYPFKVQPKVWLDTRFYDLAINQEDRQALATLDLVYQSMQILNDALPPEFQLRFANSGDRPTDEGSVIVKYQSPADLAISCGAGAVACSSATLLGNYLRTSDIIIPDNFNTTQHNKTISVIVHELLHALGIRGHVDSIEFPDSLMGKSGDFFPNPGFTIHRIDREVIQIMYMGQHTDRYNDFGEWTDTTLHLVGRTDDESVNFGVALFNGLPQPWARGTMPTTPLARNILLSGIVTWKGSLLGFSGISPVAGDAELEINMANLDAEQDLSFSDIFFINKMEESGPERWFPTRDMDYKVTMGENGFYHSSDSEHVTGVFLGKRHEGMAGTLKRTDLVGAFGGKR